MNFKEHNTAGIVTAATCCGAVFVLSNDNFLSLVAGSLAYLGSLFPDLDTASTPSRITAIFLFLLSVVLFLAGDLFYPALIGITFTFIKCSKHRGWTHTYTLPLLVSCLPYFYGFAALFWSFSLGLCMHYFCDSMSLLKRKNWFDFF